MGVSGQRHAPASLYPRERTPGTIVQEAGWASEPVWTQRLEEKSFAPAGDRTPIAPSVVRHCTDWAAPVLMQLYTFWKFCEFSVVGSEKQVWDYVTSHHHRLLPPVFPVIWTLKCTELSTGHYNICNPCRVVKHEPDACHSVRHRWLVLNSWQQYKFVQSNNEIKKYICCIM
jgi:hypothetical protein